MGKARTQIDSIVNFEDVVNIVAMSVFVSIYEKHREKQENKVPFDEISREAFLLAEKMVENRPYLFILMLVSRAIDKIYEAVDEVEKGLYPTLKTQAQESLDRLKELEMELEKSRKQGQK